MEFFKQLGEILKLDADNLEIVYTALSGFAFFLTLFFALVLGIAFIVIKKKRPDNVNAFKKLALGITIGYAITITACISLFMITRASVKGRTNVNFYLILGLTILLLAYAISALITSLTNKKAFKICNVIGLSVCAIATIVLTIVMPSLGADSSPLNNSVYVFAVLWVAVLVVLALVFGKDKGMARPTKNLAFAGVTIALSFALSYVKLFSYPFGGSITLASMLPLIIYSYVFGARKGLIAGAIYGFLQFFQSPQIYHPLQILLDYPIAFAGIGLAGIAKNFTCIKKEVFKFMLGASFSCFARFVGHFLSGIFFFGMYGVEYGIPSPVVWSLVVNLIMFAELAIILVVGCPLFASKSFNAQVQGLNPPLLKK